MNPAQRRIVSNAIVVFGSALGLWVLYMVTAVVRHPELLRNGSFVVTFGLLPLLGTFVTITVGLYLRAGGNPPN